MGDTVTDPFKSEDYTLAETMFRQAVEDNLAEEDNLNAVKTAFYKDAARAFKDGKFITRVERLIADHLWTRVNNRAAGATRRVLRELDSGQSSIPVDEWLDQVMTVGEHRRTTVRHLGQTDMLRIVQARQDNADKSQKMLDFAKRVAAKMEPVYAEVPDVGTAVERHLIVIEEVAQSADNQDEAASA